MATGLYLGVAPIDLARGSGKSYISYSIFIFYFLILHPSGMDSYSILFQGLVNYNLRSKSSPKGSLFGPGKTLQTSTHGERYFLPLILVLAGMTHLSLKNFKSVSVYKCTSFNLLPPSIKISNSFFKRPDICTYNYKNGNLVVFI